MLLVYKLTTDSPEGVYLAHEDLYVCMVLFIIAFHKIQLRSPDLFYEHQNFGKWEITNFLQITKNFGR